MTHRLHSDVPFGERMSVVDRRLMDSRKRKRDDDDWDAVVSRIPPPPRTVGYTSLASMIFNHQTFARGSVHNRMYPARNLDTSLREKAAKLIAHFLAGKIKRRKALDALFTVAEERYPGYSRHSNQRFQVFNPNAGVYITPRWNWYRFRGLGAYRRYRAIEAIRVAFRIYEHAMRYNPHFAQEMRENRHVVNFRLESVWNLLLMAKQHIDLSRAEDPTFYALTSDYWQTFIDDYRRPHISTPIVVDRGGVDRPFLTDSRAVEVGGYTFNYQLEDAVSIFTDHEQLELQYIQDPGQESFEDRLQRVIPRTI